MAWFPTNWGPASCFSPEWWSKLLKFCLFATRFPQINCLEIEVVVGVSKHPCQSLAPEASNIRRRHFLSKTIFFKHNANPIKDCTGGTIYLVEIYRSLGT